MAQIQEYIATGRRKTAVARIRMTAGTGKIEVNGKAFEEYFTTQNLQNQVLQPLQVAKGAKAFDVSVNARGGGSTGRPVKCAWNSAESMICQRNEPSDGRAR